MSTSGTRVWTDVGDLARGLTDIIATNRRLANEAPAGATSDRPGRPLALARSRATRASLIHQLPPRSPVFRHEQEHREGSGLDRQPPHQQREGSRGADGQLPVGGCWALRRMVHPLHDEALEVCRARYRSRHACRRDGQSQPRDAGHPTGPCDVHAPRYHPHRCVRCVRESAAFQGDHNATTLKLTPRRPSNPDRECWAGQSQRRSLNTVYRTTDTMSIKPSANG